MNEYTQIFLEAYGGSCFDSDLVDIQIENYIVIEGFLSDIYNKIKEFIIKVFEKVCSVFKQVWNKILSTLKRIKNKLYQWIKISLAL